MLIEVLEPLTIRLPEGERRLMVGQAVDLSEERASKLLARAPGKVRPMAPLNASVEWCSPLLGLMRAEVVAVREDGLLEVYHPVTERLFQVPLHWVCRVIPPDSQRNGG